MALTPSHPLVDKLTHADHKVAIQLFQNQAAASSRSGGEVKQTGEFTGSFAIHPVTGRRVPIWIADYVLAEYGTGAVMGVPAHDERDFQFALSHQIPMKAVVSPATQWLEAHAPAPDRATLRHYVDAPSAFGEAYTGQGPLLPIKSADLPIAGLPSTEGGEVITRWLEVKKHGQGRVRYKLKDWLFSRQRYWGEPFPIVFDPNGRAYPLSIDSLPVTLPELSDFTPVSSDDPESQPVPPLAKATNWSKIQGVILDDGSVRPVEGRKRGEEILVDGVNRTVQDIRRELNTMPNWAGSCWYYLRYFDPKNNEAFVSPHVEQYWSLGTGRMPGAGSIDLYMGGAEHAVLHLLYARFWHKVLYDLSHISTHEPFDTLFNQGMITADAYRDTRGVYHQASEVVVKEVGGVRQAYHPQTRQELEIVAGKMGKRYKNGVAPEDVCSEFSARTS